MSRGLALNLGLGLTLGQGGGWTPANLGALLLGWWSADRDDLITLSGAQVTSWKDVVAGYDATQAIGASRPTYATNFNGAPVLTFDGIDDELTLASMPFPSGANALEVWAVLSQDVASGSAGTKMAVSWGGTSNASRGAIARTVVTGVNRFQGNVGDGASAIVVQEASVDASTRHVVRLQIGATQSIITVDRATPVTQAVVPAIGSTPRVRFGANTANTAGSFWGGKIRDVIFTSPLTIDQATKLQTYALARRML